MQFSTMRRSLSVPEKRVLMMSAPSSSVKREAAAMTSGAADSGVVTGYP